MESPDGLACGHAHTTSPQASCSIGSVCINPGPHRFDARDRRRLLSQPGIGPGVLSRLEAAGVYSLKDIRSQGIDNVIARVERDLGPSAWSNRRRALARVVYGFE